MRARLSSALLALLFVSCGSPAPPAGLCTANVPVTRTQNLDALLDATAPAVGPTRPAPTRPHWRWINMWATWCKTCVKELPALDTLARALDGRVALVLLSVDEDPELARAFAADHALRGVRHAGGADRLHLLSSLGVPPNTGLPAHIFIDPEGRVRCHREGPLGPQDAAALRQLMSTP